MVSAKTTPSWVLAAESVVNTDVELCTLRQEKENPAFQKAWFTCEYCPQPLRWVGESLPLRKEGILGWEWVGVKRCRPCNRKRARHHRAKRDLSEMLEKQIEHMGTSARFVTLTEPNTRIEFVDGTVPDQAMADEVRRFKKQIYDFTRRDSWKNKVVGAISFIEQTYHVDEAGVDVNTHAHLVILGSYWKQKELQEDWGHGIVDISKPKNKRAVMKYISKYVTKDDVKGVRCKEKYGIMRGRAVRR